MELNVALKMLLIDIIFELQVTTNQNVIKDPCFEFLSRILTCTLTLSRQILVIRFSATHWFFQILSHFLLFCEAGSKSGCAANQYS